MKISNNFHVSITRDVIVIEDQMRQLHDKNSSGYYGALISFSGIARDCNRFGKVTELYVEHYEEMTQKSLIEVAKRVQADYQIGYTHIIHRYGIIKPGSVIIFAACLSKHRRGGFAAVSDIIEALKTSVPFWKKEKGSFGELWVKPESKKLQQ